LTVPSSGDAVIPGFRYRDAASAINWLDRAFGFRSGLVVPGDGGTIAHAQLTLDTAVGPRGGMIMVGSASDNDFGRLVSPPAAGGVCTQAAYVVVADADEHYARAVAEGAEILLDIQDMDYGGRGYTCRDPEGHVWSFGTYDPWEEGA